jgi:uncharacterized protein (DUF1697 family)
MYRYVAFLRGINLGGRRIKNEDLRGRFEEMGLDGVATFRASGNVVFDAGDDDSASLTERIEVELGESLGYEVPVFLRVAEEMLEIAVYQPFDPSHVEASAGKLQVSMLGEAPSAKVRREVLAMASDEDRLDLRGRELFWLPSGGMLESSLDLDAIDALLGPSTRRTKGTIDLIVEKHFAS